MKEEKKQKKLKKEKKEKSKRLSLRVLRTLGLDKRGFKGSRGVLGDGRGIWGYLGDSEGRGFFGCRRRFLGVVLWELWFGCCILGWIFEFVCD